MHWNSVRDFGRRRKTEAAACDILTSVALVQQRGGDGSTTRSLPVICCFIQGIATVYRPSNRPPQRRWTAYIAFCFVKVLRSHLVQLKSVAWQHRRLFLLATAAIRVWRLATRQKETGKEREREREALRSKTSAVCAVVKPEDGVGEWGGDSSDIRNARRTRRRASFQGNRSRALLCRAGVRQL